jgi:hypothetical protein
LKLQVALCCGVEESAATQETLVVPTWNVLFDAGVQVVV